MFATQRTGHRSPQTTELSDAGEVNSSGSLRAFAADRSMRLITLGQFLIGPAMVLPNVAFSVLFVERWGLSPAVAPVQFAITTGLCALFQTSVTRWVAGRERGTLIALGALLTTATAAPLIVLPQLHGLAAWSYVVAVAVLLAAADMIYLPAANAVMAEAPHPRIRGRAIGVFQSASSIGMALFPLTLGLLDSRMPWLLWLIATGVFLTAAWAWRGAVRGLPQRVRVAELTDIDA
ncbi:MFS transporter [Curtobacterium flaccumfaciens]|uniref:MFS transporter n=1 Tax=Curtobacterium flaccumfaciens TaxID=2035 RepID=UPI0013758D63|nr:MFS transporter [Curtobacterium flaccumfaciens]